MNNTKQLNCCNVTSIISRSRAGCSSDPRSVLSLVSPTAQVQRILYFSIYSRGSFLDEHQIFCGKFSISTHQLGHSLQAWYNVQYPPRRQMERAAGTQYGQCVSNLANCNPPTDKVPKIKRHIHYQSIAQSVMTVLVKPCHEMRLCLMSNICTMQYRLTVALKECLQKHQVLHRWTAPLSKEPAAPSRAGVPGVVDLHPLLDMLLLKHSENKS